MAGRPAPSPIFRGAPLSGRCETAHLFMGLVTSSPGYMVVPWAFWAVAQALRGLRALVWGVLTFLGILASLLLRLWARLRWFGEPNGEKLQIDAREVTGDGTSGAAGARMPRISPSVDNRPLRATHRRAPHLRAEPE